MTTWRRPRTPSTSRMVNIGDLALHTTHYRGHGPEILLVHGISSSSATWNPIIDRLATHLSPITVDLRGHGLSNKPPSGYLYDDYARDLDALLDALDLNHPLIMGHSLGGILTLWWAMQHPTRARGLIIEDSPLVSSIRFRPAFDGWILLNVMPYDMLKRLYAREHPDWPERIVEQRARVMKTTRRAVFTELRDKTVRRLHLDQGGAMQSITAPVLYVHGETRSGSLVQPDHAYELPGHLPRVETVQIPEGTHAMHRDQPEMFLNAVFGFLQEHEFITPSTAKEPHS